MNTELRSFDAVLFDFADTLFDSRSALLPDVMAQHSAILGMRVAPRGLRTLDRTDSGLGGNSARLARMPSCDYSPDLHRTSWNAVVHACEGIPPAFAQPFYAVFCDAKLWRPIPGLRSRPAHAQNRPNRDGHRQQHRLGHPALPGCQSNDRPDRYRSAVVPGWTTQTTREMFLAVLRNLRIEPARALIVGDNWRTDSAAAVGIATLVLPVSPANRRHRELDIVLRMAGIELLLRESCAIPG
ncbi:MAG: hypothetical protein PPHEESC_5157 [uncultured Paraburkholderia sp.]|nr:MAG: hypothetical protein PPHEESC_5157 [uncultured Paraburkholderia sp.]CAH2940452.1 MAG: hypothetical protein PPHERAN_5110 [uncultured Paraburkholderia sp.]